ncbi:unnamed protein product [marine sediment metagenome]|uniref:Uncharacterized protein n=1 Tax=marine sediment metagenome TaxID=412755 RepID=X1JFG3_9ZZZZ
MMAEDVAVWSRYLANPLRAISEVWYDVHVGKPVDVGEDASDMDRRIAAGITRKRIDVVALVGDVFWVIEVKPRADMVAVGQAVSYPRLFLQEFELRRDVLGVIICDQVDEDIVSICEALGVVVIANF